MGKCCKPFLFAGKEIGKCHERNGKQKSIQCELSLPAKLLYCTLRVHSNSPEERECLSMHGKETGIEYDPDIFFVFPASHQRLYGYKDRRNVEKYMRELTAAGFIKKVESNWNLRQVTVYQFVSDWKS